MGWKSGKEGAVNGYKGGKKGTQGDRCRLKASRQKQEGEEVIGGMGKWIQAGGNGLKANVGL